jgi:hypothetical protein
MIMAGVDNVLPVHAPFFKRKIEPLERGGGIIERNSALKKT